MQPIDNPQQTSGTEGKTIAIISYLTPIGWIIAYVLYGTNKSKLAIYHLRQTLLLMLAALGLYAVQSMLLFIPFIGWMITAVSMLLNIGILVLWVIGLIATVNGEEKPIPFVGEKAQVLFSKLG